MHVYTQTVILLLSILIIEMPQYNKSQAIVYLKQKFSLPKATWKYQNLICIFTVQAIALCLQFIVAKLFLYVVCHKNRVIFTPSSSIFSFSTLHVLLVEFSFHWNCSKQ